MNWLKTLWNKLVNKTSVSAEPGAPDSKPISCGEILLEILQEAACSRAAQKVNTVELFEEWYDGPCDRESILASLEEFKKAHGAVNAKLQGKI